MYIITALDFGLAVSGVWVLFVGALLLPLPTGAVPGSSGGSALLLRLFHITLHAA